MHFLYDPQISGFLLCLFFFLVLNKPTFDFQISRIFSPNVFFTNDWHFFSILILQKFPNYFSLWELRFFGFRLGASFFLENWSILWSIQNFCCRNIDYNNILTAANIELSYRINHFFIFVFSVLDNYSIGMYISR